MNQDIFTALDPWPGFALWFRSHAVTLPKPPRDRRAEKSDYISIS